MLSMSPLVKSASISWLPVCDTYPPYNTLKSVPIVWPFIWKNDNSMVETELTANAIIAGIFFRDRNMSIIRGTMLYQLISPVSFRVYLNSSIWPMLVWTSVGDKSANSSRVIIKAGIVAQPMSLICSNRSTSAIDVAKFVVSDRRDILSLKKAPKNMVPAVIGKDRPRVEFVPIQVAPIVDIVVSKLPIHSSAIEVIINTTA